MYILFDSTKKSLTEEQVLGEWAVTMAAKCEYTFIVAFVETNSLMPCNLTSVTLTDPRAYI